MPTPISPEIIGEREKFLIYGAPKRGKTFLALTSPEPIYMLCVGGDNEVKTYFGEDFQKKHGKKDLSIDAVKENVDKMGRVKEPSGFDDVCRALDDALELDAKEEFPSQTGTFETLIIDNATVMQEFQMNKTIHIANTARDPDKTGYSTWEAYTKHGILTPFDSDWGGAQSLMQDWVSWMFNLDKNIIFIAHEYEVTRTSRATQVQEIVGIRPLFVGKQRTRIANAFDNVWRMTKNAQKYEARTTPGGEIADLIAGTRLGGIVPNDYQDPNISKTIKKFKEQAIKVGGKK